MTAEFTVPEEPKGKGRPRFVARGMYVQTYTPKDTADYEQLVRNCYGIQCRRKFFEGAVRAEVTGYFSIPKSASKKKRKQILEGKVPYTKKIDCDNLEKVVLDALNRVAYQCVKISDIKGEKT